MVNLNRVYPNVAYLSRRKTRKSVPDVAAHSLGQGEAYFTVREVLAEASTAADGVLSREHSGFYRCRYATLGFTLGRSEELNRGLYNCYQFEPTPRGTMAIPAHQVLDGALALLIKD